MWRLYAELFVLVVVAYALGAALASLVIRLVVKDKTAPSGAPDAVDTAGTPGGAT